MVEVGMGRSRYHVKPRVCAPVRMAPDARLVTLVSHACEQVIPMVRSMDQAAGWTDWAERWIAGDRQPGMCVSVAHDCFESHKRGYLAGGALGQLAWAAKEACYETPTSPWLVIRYVADAMIAFGIAYPDRVEGLLPSPTSVGFLPQ
jgi:hypothetical protein